MIAARRKKLLADAFAKYMYYRMRKAFNKLEVVNMITTETRALCFTAVQPLRLVGWTMGQLPGLLAPQTQIVHYDAGGPPAGTHVA
jgi:hypothetical protein